VTGECEWRKKGYRQLGYILENENEGRMIGEASFTERRKKIPTVRIKTWGKVVSPECI